MPFDGQERVPRVGEPVSLHDPDLHPAAVQARRRSRVRSHDPPRQVGLRPALLQLAVDRVDSLVGGQFADQAHGQRRPDDRARRRHRAASSNCRTSSVNGAVRAATSSARCGCAAPRWHRPPSPPRRPRAARRGPAPARRAKAPPGRGRRRRGCPSAGSTLDRARRTVCGVRRRLRMRAPSMSTLRPSAVASSTSPSLSSTFWTSAVTPRYWNVASARLSPSSERAVATPGTNVPTEAAIARTVVARTALRMVPPSHGMAEFRGLRCAWLSRMVRSGTRVARRWKPWDAVAAIPVIDPGPSPRSHLGAQHRRLR